MFNLSFKNHSICELKLDEEKGIFSGYASTFGNVDLSNEIVVKGSFMESVSKGRQFPLLYQHKSDLPIGLVEVQEDERGLYINKGELNLDLQLAREVRSNVQKGIIKSFSIGYRVKEDDWQDDGVRLLKKLDLKEVSFVTFPANEQAGVIGMKSIRGNISNIRDFEAFLRDAGFSRSEAKAIASHGYKAIKNSCEENSEEALELVTKLNNLLTEIATKRA